MIASRLQIQFFVITLLLMGLAARLFHIQVYNGLNYSEMAQRQFVKKVKAETTRGEILDRNSLILATSIECQSIFAHPKEMDASQGILRILENTLEVETSL